MGSMSGMCDMNDMNGMDGMNDMDGMDGMNGMGDTGSTSMSMAMYFNFMMPGTVVFDGWLICVQSVLIGSCFGVFGLAAVYEMLKNARQLWATKVARDTLKTMVQMSSDNADEGHDDGDVISGLPRSAKFWLIHFVQSILHMVQVFLAYILMLIVMTFNVWLVISVIIGAGVGYLLTGSLKNPSLTAAIPEKKCEPRHSTSTHQSELSIPRHLNTNGVHLSSNGYDNNIEETGY